MNFNEKEFLLRIVGLLNAPDDVKDSIGDLTTKQTHDIYMLIVNLTMFLVEEDGFEQILGLTGEMIMENVEGASCD